MTGYTGLLELKSRTKIQLEVADFYQAIKKRTKYKTSDNKNKHELISISFNVLAVMYQDYGKLIL